MQVYEHKHMSSIISLPLPSHIQGHLSSAVCVKAINHHCQAGQELIADQFTRFYIRVSKSARGEEAKQREAAHHSRGQVSSQRGPAQDQRQHSKHHHPAGTPSNNKVTVQLRTWKW